MASRERRIEGSFSFLSKMSALTARCDGSITEERDGDSRGWLGRTVGKGKHATPGDGSTECLVCGKRGHTVDTCFRIHKRQICGKHSHLTSTCYQNLDQNLNRSLSSIGSSPECQICSKKGHTAAKCFYRTDVPADHPSLFVPTCQICGLKGHTAAKCFYRTDVSDDHPSLFIPTCQICGLKNHVALNCTHRTTFAYQVSESPTSLTALTSLSAGSYNGNHTQSQGVYYVSNACFPGGFNPNNGASTPVNSEVWISDSQRMPVPGAAVAAVHLSQLPTELMRDHNSVKVVSTSSDDSVGTGGNGNAGNNMGSHNGEGHDDYDSGSNSAGSENASNHGCNSDFVNGSHVVTCEEDNIHVLNATIQGAYVDSNDSHDSNVGDQADDSNADNYGGQNSLAFSNNKTFQKALNSSFEFISLSVDDKLQKGLREVCDEDVEVVLDKQHLAKRLLFGKRDGGQNSLAFSNNKTFQKALNSSFEFISLSVDDKLQKGLREVCDEDVEVVLDKQHLAKRLLFGKRVCGYQFTSKLTGAMK